MKFDPPLQEAVLVRRYKRFLADVEMPGGAVTTIHCPNTGAMTHCAEPGSQVWYSTSDNPKRKYAHTWELVRDEHANLVCINSARANSLVKEALEQGQVRGLSHFESLQTEVRYGESSRVDIKLTLTGGGAIYVEVKSATLLDDPVSGRGSFPDAVSNRAVRHLAELVQVVRSGSAAALIYCAQHSGIKSVQAARHIDPAYADALHEAQCAGVKLLALGVAISPTGMEVTGELPVLD